MKTASKLIFTVLVILMAGSCKKDKPTDDQTPEKEKITVLLEKTYAGTFDWGSGNINLIHTNDNGFAFISRTLNKQLFIAKANASLDTVWTKILSDSINDIGNFIQTSDNGFIITGTKKGPDWNWVNIYTLIIKLDQFGNLQWERKYGDSYMDEGYSIKQISDGGYIIALDNDEYTAQGENHMSLLKLNAAGDSCWFKDYLEYPYTAGYDLQIINDTNLIIVGYNLILKSDMSGNKIWGKAMQDEDFFSVQVLPDQSFITLGRNGTNRHYLLRKFDTNGNLIWTKEYPYTDFDYAQNLYITYDGGIIFTGNSDDGYNNKMVVVLTDGSGNKENDYTFYKGELDKAVTVIQTDDHNFLLLYLYLDSSTNSFLSLMKFTFNN